MTNIFIIKFGWNRTEPAEKWRFKILAPMGSHVNKNEKKNRKSLKMESFENYVLNHSESYPLDGKKGAKTRHFPFCRSHDYSFLPSLAYREDISDWKRALVSVLGQSEIYPIPFPHHPADVYRQTMIGYRLRLGWENNARSAIAPFNSYSVPQPAVLTPAQSLLMWQRYPPTPDVGGDRLSWQDW